jgi:hypothetical protein
MSNSAFYLCLDTDAGEYELLSRHDTYNEASAALQDLDTTSVELCRCSVKSVDALESQIESMTEALFETELRIDRKETQCDATRQARTIIRGVRDTLLGAVYLPLTEKYIELSDTLEKGERYIANRRRDIGNYRYCIERWACDLEKLRNAIDNLPIENSKAINLMETRSRAVRMSNKTCVPVRHQAATNDDGP